LEIERAKAEATLVRLRSQRDMLNARMKAVEAGQRGEGTAGHPVPWVAHPTRFRWDRKRLLAVAGVAALVLGAFSLWLSGKLRVERNRCAVVWLIAPNFRVER
jgi:hypothetical protein